MFYEQIIKLMNLKPCKWYNFIKKSKNYNLIHSVLLNISRYLNNNWMYNKIDVMLEFAQCVNAIEPLVSSKITNIKVYGLNEAENRAYGCSGDIVSLGIDNCIVGIPISVSIHKKSKRMTVTYTYDSKIYNFTLYDNEENTRSLSNTDRFVLIEMQDCINQYIKTVTEFLVNKYT